jgi:hypothetical protein
MIPKNDLHILYQDSCDIFSLTSRIDPDSQETLTDWSPSYSNVPCRISFTSPITSFSPHSSVNNINQNIKLFLDNQYSVKPGDKIIVTRNGLSLTYQYAGESNYYESHREIELKKFDTV